MPIKVSIRVWGANKKLMLRIDFLFKVSFIIVLYTRVKESSQMVDHPKTTVSMALGSSFGLPKDMTSFRSICSSLSGKQKTISVYIRLNCKEDISNVLFTPLFLHHMFFCNLLVISQTTASSAVCHSSFYYHVFREHSLHCWSISSSSLELHVSLVLDLYSTFHLHVLFFVPRPTSH